MFLRNRALLLLFLGVFGVLAGCGGGGGSSPVPHSTPTASGSATPPGSTQYRGTSLTTDTNYETTPNPVSTTDVSVERGVTDEGSATFNGASVEEFQTVDIDTWPLQSVTVTTNNYVTPVTSSTTMVYDYGFTSTSTTGQSITKMLNDVPASNGLTDELPEAARQTWQNDGAYTLAESESDGFTANRTESAGGAYVENDSTPQNSQVSPAPTPLAATATALGTGQASYVFDFLGGNPATFTFSAPAGGVITVGENIPAPVGPYSNTFTIPAWFSSTPLYTETYVDNGSQAVPGGCNVAASYGTSGNQIVKTVNDVDPAFGTDETYTDTEYHVNDFNVCTVVADTVKSYYDFTGQSGEAPLGIGFSTTGSPLLVNTTASTIGLETTTSTNAARVRALARMAAMAQSFAVSRERARLQRRDQAYMHLRSIFAGRLHR